MDEEKKLDEKALEEVTGGTTQEEYLAARSFRGPFISANCSRCAKRGTDDCTYANDNVFEMLAMYYRFRNQPNCPNIIVK